MPAVSPGLAAARGTLDHPLTFQLVGRFEDVDELTTISPKRTYGIVLAAS